MKNSIFHIFYLFICFCLISLVPDNANAQGCGFTSSNDWVCGQGYTGAPFGGLDAAEASTAPRFSPDGENPGTPTISPPPPYVPPTSLPWTPGAPVIYVPEPPPIPQPPPPTAPPGGSTDCDPSLSGLENGMALIEAREGGRQNCAYQLPGEAHVTIGVGHYDQENNYSLGQCISDAEVEQLLQADVQDHAPYAQRWIDELGVGNCPCVEAVFYSTAWQWPAFGNSSIYEALRAGDYARARQLTYTNWAQFHPGHALYEGTQVRAQDMRNAIDMMESGNCGTPNASCAGASGPVLMCPPVTNGGPLTIYHNHTGETRVIDPNNINQAEINAFFADHRDGGQQHPNGFDPNVVVFLADIRNVLQTRYPTSPLTINITSAYRTPARNATIEGAAANSQHTHGRAIDFSIPGVSPKEIADIANCMQRGGTGIYNTFVHIDTGPVRNWDNSSQYDFGSSCQNVPASQCDASASPDAGVSGTTGAAAGTCGGSSGGGTGGLAGLLSGGSGGGTGGTGGGLSGFLSGLTGLPGGLSTSLGSFGALGSLGSLSSLGGLGSLGSLGSLTNLVNLGSLTSITGSLTSNLTSTLSGLSGLQSFLSSPNLSTLTSLSSLSGSLGNLTQLQQSMASIGMLGSVLNTGNLTNLTSSLSGITNLQTAFGDLSSLTTSLNSLGNLNTALSDLTNLSNLQTTLSSFGNLSSLQTDISNLTSSIGNLNSLTSMLGDVTQTINQVNDLQNIVSQFGSLPDLQSVMGNLGNIGDLTTQLSALQTQLGNATSLADLGSLGTQLSSLGNLAQVQTTINEAISGLNQTNLTNTLLNSSFGGLTNISSVMNSMNDITNTLSDIQGLATDITNATAMFNDLTQITANLGQIEASISTINNLSATLSAADLQIDTGFIQEVQNITSAIQTIESIQGFQDIANLTSITNTLDTSLNSLGDLSAISNDLGLASDFASSLQSQATALSSITDVQQYTNNLNSLQNVLSSLQ